MAALSNYLENALFNAVLRNTTYTSPATVYAAIFTADPGETGASGEVSGNGYARQAVTFTAPSDGAGDNTAALTFTADGGAWGTITHFAIFDALSGGNMLFHGTATNKIIADGDSYQFPIGALDLAFQ